MDDLICPKCHEILPREELQARAFQCPGCAAWLRRPRWPDVMALLLSLLISLLIVQSMGIKTHAAILWVPVFLVCRIFGVVFILPFSKLKVADGPPSSSPWRRDLVLFLSCWLFLSLYFMAYCYVIAGSVFVFGASSEDIREITDMASVPLGMVNSDFVVRSDKNFAVVFLIIGANSYFYALGSMIAFKIVHRM